MRKLHIGGQEKKEGWEIFNAVPGELVDHLGNANDLSRFEDETFDEIYSSHMVEHLDYKDELARTLKEWFRVLKSGGTMYVSVPDMDILCQLFLMKDKLTFQERFEVMRMMFGGHIDEYDYHYVGLNADFLATYLNETGFTKIERVQDFNIFKDASGGIFKGVNISVNMKAKKP